MGDLRADPRLMHFTSHSPVLWRGKSTLNRTTHQGSPPLTGSPAFCCHECILRRDAIQGIIVGRLTKSHWARAIYLVDRNFFWVRTLLWRRSIWNTRIFDRRYAGGIVCQVHAWLKGDSGALVHPL